MKLINNWKIRHFDVGDVRDLEVASLEYIDYFWMTAPVPGDVHSALIDRKLIDDPFYGHNDLKCQWIEEKVWWYRTTFDFSGIKIKRKSLNCFLRDLTHMQLFT